MSKTIVVEFPLPVAGNVLTAVKRAMTEIELPNDNEEVNLNYNNGCKYAYLDCARAMLEEEIEDN